MVDTGGYDTGGHDRRIVAAAMALAAEKGWRRLTLAEVAAAADLSLVELRECVSNKAEILAALVREADRRMLAAAPGATAADESPRDRLFDVLMARFEALAPYREGIAAVLHDGFGDPISALCAPPRLLRAMRWALEAAGIGTGGVIGRLRVKGVAAVYAATMRVWLHDDSGDLGPTMAALDKRLGQAERAARLCRRWQPGFCRHHADDAMDAAESPPPPPPSRDRGDAKAKSRGRTKASAPAARKSPGGTGKRPKSARAGGGKAGGKRG